MGIIEGLSENEDQSCQQGKHDRLRFKRWSLSNMVTGLAHQSNPDWRKRHPLYELFMKSKKSTDVDWDVVDVVDEFDLICL